jgi:hypothetical protein
MIAGSHELDEVNMPSTALRNSEEYEVDDGRKPPVAETNWWPKGYGAVSPLSSPSSGTAVEVAKSTPNTIAFPALPPAQERLLNAREVAARMGSRSVANFIRWLATNVESQF